jgi:hypothetical protein
MLHYQFTDLILFTYFGPSTSQDSHLFLQTFIFIKFDSVLLIDCFQNLVAYAILIQLFEQLFYLLPKCIEESHLNVGSRLFCPLLNCFDIDEASANQVNLRKCLFFEVG